MRFPQGAEWLIILVLILLLFGAKRLPDAARGLGRSLRILKAETKGMHEEDENGDNQVAAASNEQLPPSPPQAAPAASDQPQAQPADAPAPDSSKSQP
jgi:sec-independent protein translocase protein TatA